MMIPLYIFEEPLLDEAGDDFVAVAPTDAVIATYGGGGLGGEDGIGSEFKAALFYKDDETGASFLGIWGRRRVAKLHARLRKSGFQTRIVCDTPPASLVFKRADNPKTIQ